MPIRVVCRSCGRQLNAPDNLAGRKAKCPGCQTVLPIPAAEPVDVAQSAAKERKLPRRQQPEPEERITREPEVVEEPEEVAEVAHRPKKPRRKKPRPAQQREEQQFPAWGLWLLVAGVVLLLVGSMAVGAAYKGHAEEVLVYSVILAIMIPISIFILIISMFISSSLGGGIEFGDARVVIPKSFVLLLIVNLVSLLPAGRFLAIPVWVLGLMLLFRLDVWEARVLYLVNWGLNYLAQMAVFTAIMAAMAH